MRTIIKTNNAPAAIGAYSQAVKVGETVYISGQIPLDPGTMDIVSGDFSGQVLQVIDNLAAIATEAGGTLSDIVKLTVYLTDMDDFAALNELMVARFEPPFPARAVVQVSALPKGVKIEVDAVLVLAC